MAKKYLIDSVKESNLSWGGQEPPVTNPSPLGENGKKALDGSILDFGGQTPPVTNPSPLGENGKKTLEGSVLDRNNGQTPPSYNPPRN